MFSPSFFHFNATQYQEFLLTQISHLSFTFFKSMPSMIMFLLLFVHFLWHQVGDAALMYASREGRTAVVKLLLEAGADVDAKNEVRHYHKLTINYSNVYYFFSHQLFGA
jgi:hypothetical protein